MTVPTGNGNPFKQATKRQSKLRLSLAGPSGSGKTYSALRIGTALAEGAKVAVLDTEHGSASKYADLFAFDVVELTAPFHPDRYVETIHAAGEAGYPVMVVDSLSHAWNGPGGLLEIVDQISARMKSTNTFAAWKDATPIQNRLIEGLLSAPLHLIGCMRSKTEYIIETNDRGKSVPRKIGMAPIQRDNLEYEFDVYAEMDLDHRMLVSKTRCPALDGKVIEKPGEDVAAILKGWLSDGAPALDSPASLELVAEIKTLRDGRELPEEHATRISQKLAAGLTIGQATDIRDWLKEQPVREGMLV